MKHHSRSCRSAEDASCVVYSSRYYIWWIWKPIMYKSYTPKRFFFVFFVYKTNRIVYPISKRYYCGFSPRKLHCRVSVVFSYVMCCGLYDDDYDLIIWTKGDFSLDRARRWPLRRRIIVQRFAAICRRRGS